MDERTEQLIRELADKFGTTAEHLWQVMITQAYIINSIELVVCVIFSILVPISFSAIKRKSNDYSAAELLWFGWGMGAFIISIIVLLSISGIIAGIINPEFWALEQILKR